jgi:hypothetical protein
MLHCFQYTRNYICKRANLLIIKINQSQLFLKAWEREVFALYLGSVTDEDNVTIQLSSSETKGRGDLSNNLPI